MGFKKYNQSASGASWFLLAVAFILLAVLALLAYRRGGQFINITDNKKSPPILSVNKTERAFEILAKSAVGYKARAIDNKEEVDIIIPQKNLQPNTVVILKNYIIAANGLVSQGAQILPPPPVTKPTGQLPEKPE